MPPSYTLRKSNKKWVMCGRIGVKEEKRSVVHEVPAKYRALSQCAVPSNNAKLGETHCIGPHPIPLS
jgi:hypothetical protein